jgi:pimeloyl-ACP methyl ester carboxylesterase
MSHSYRGYFAGPRGQVHFRRAVSAGRPLLLLHQSPLSGTQFDAVMPLLSAAGFQPIALDMPGFGMSDVAGDGATLDDFASIVPAALDQFGVASAPLIGHHTGAVVGALASTRWPARIESLVLNGYPILDAAERAHFATFYFGPKEPQADGSHLLTAWNNRLRSTPGWTDLRLMHRYTIEALYRGDSNWRAFPLVIGADMEALLRRVTVRTLLLTNTGEDLYASTRRAHALRPDFAYAELQGGTHDIIDEQPGPWSRAVLDFLQSEAIR